MDLRQFRNTKSQLVSPIDGAMMSTSTSSPHSLMYPPVNSEHWTTMLDIIYNDGGHRNLTYQAIEGDIENRCLPAAKHTIPLFEQESGNNTTADDDLEDDLDADIARAALDTGVKAFDLGDWDEASSLLQEALQTLQHVPPHQRRDFDIHGLHYRLAVCAYHTQHLAIAEDMLTKFVQKASGSSIARLYMFDAVHLLSKVYIRMGRVDDAQFECEKALQARRRYLGKHSDAAMESTALLAHLHALLNNLARAKSFLAMIPEAQREKMMQDVEASLRTLGERREHPSDLTGQIVKVPNSKTEGYGSRLSGNTLGPSSKSHLLPPLTPTMSPSSVESKRIYKMDQSAAASVEEIQSITSLTISTNDVLPRSLNRHSFTDDLERIRHSVISSASRQSTVSRSLEVELTKALTRKEILDNLGCHPRDQIEEAVCEGDDTALANLLEKKRDFWRAKIRKHTRSERLTALHFAALFGDIDAAQRLLMANYNINEVPYGYSTRLSPIVMAIGARQVEMVRFLILNGAKPSKPDSWSTLASQLLSRSWLTKTMSQADRDAVPSRVVAVLTLILDAGWDMDAPYEESGRTVLHQVAAFWTGSYDWDMKMRQDTAMFLCKKGADPFKLDQSGKTAYDMAVASRHYDLVSIFSQTATIEHGSAQRQPVFELAA